MPLLPEIPERPGSPTAGQRAGFWIVSGTTLFQVGYPILMAVSFEPHPVLAILILGFALLAFPMHLGLVWARFLNVALSFLVGGFLLLGMLVALASFGDRLGDSWPVFLMLPVLPGVAYTLCAFLLLLPAAGLWQRRVIEQIQWRMRLGEPPREFDPPIDPAEPPTACYWCEALVVRVGDTHCRACRRPIG